MRDATAGSVAQGRVFFGAAVAAAVCQVGLSARVEYADDYLITVVIAWFSALFLAWRRGSGAVGSPGPVMGAIGGVATVGSIVLLAWSPAYHPFYRALPCVAGVGLLLAATGGRTRGWVDYGGPVVLLPVTTWCAMALNRAVGSPITMDGNVLRMPHENLEIGEGCCGLWAIARLAILAALVVALFPTTWRQRAVLLATAVVVGFCSNAARIAILAATVLVHDDAGFDYWHQGLGATFFTVAASAAAGLVWWLILRRTLLMNRSPVLPPPAPSPAPPSASLR
jgi:exosortase/archaeosortase family protein